MSPLGSGATYMDDIIVGELHLYKIDTKELQAVVTRASLEVNKQKVENKPINAVWHRGKVVRKTGRITSTHVVQLAETGSYGLMSGATDLAFEITPGEDCTHKWTGTCNGNVFTLNVEADGHTITLDMEAWDLDVEAVGS